MLMYQYDMCGEKMSLSKFFKITIKILEKTYAAFDTLICGALFILLFAMNLASNFPLFLPFLHRFFHRTCPYPYLVYLAEKEKTNV